MCTHSRVRGKKSIILRGLSVQFTSDPQESLNIEGQSAPKKLQIKLFIVEAMTAARNDYFYRGTSDLAMCDPA